MASTTGYREFKHDITFSSVNITEANYWFRAIGPLQFTELNYFYVDITSYSTSGGMSVGSNSMQNVLKVL